MMDGERKELVNLIGKTLAYLVIVPFITMWLWNWLMPYLFKLPTLTFWQALGLIILCNGLFRPRD